MSEDAPTDERGDRADPEREDADAATDDGSPDPDATGEDDREPAEPESDSGVSRQVVGTSASSERDEDRSERSTASRRVEGAGAGQTSRSEAGGPETAVEERGEAARAGSSEPGEDRSETAERADSGGPGSTGAVAVSETDADANDTDQGEGIEPGGEDEVPEDVRSYDRFQKVDRASYDRVNEFLRDRTYVTAREWAIARLCADFRTATGVEMTKIGENLPHLVPFMTDTYSPQAVNQARSAFEEKVRMAGATFLYGAMSGFYSADELDDLMYEVTEVAKFLLEVEGVELTVEEELDAEDRISAVMREVRQASEELRYDEVACPHCGEAFEPGEHEH